MIRVVVGVVAFVAAHFINRWTEGAEGLVGFLGTAAWAGCLTLVVVLIYDAWKGRSSTHASQD